MVKGTRMETAPGRARGFLVAIAAPVALAGVVSLVLAGAACNAVLGIATANLEDAGGGDAGSPCAAYCAAVVANCQLEGGTEEEYYNPTECETLCATLDQGQPSDTSGDTLGCRAHYAQLAATDKSNCRAAGPLGGGVCGSACQSFCQMDTQVCTGMNAEYDGGDIGCESACMTDFPTYPTGTSYDLSPSNEYGDTLVCRMWHLQAALGGGASTLQLHCPHTAIVSAFCNNNDAGN